MTSARVIPIARQAISASAKRSCGRTTRAALIEGLPISLVNHTEVLAEMDRAIAAMEPGHYIAITNTESMYHGLRIPAHGTYIRNADFSLCDGIGIIIAGWAWGHKLRRLNGPVLQLECSRYGIDKGWRHFYYGGKERVADEMARRLKAQFPGLIVCGTYQPPFRKLTAEEKEAVILQINAARPDIIWVGLGLPQAMSARTENIWAALTRKHRTVGVGAAFDYHAGMIP